MAALFIAGNWKMNTTLETGIHLAKTLKDPLERLEGVTSVLCPPFVSLHAVSQVLKSSSVAVGAQNVSHRPPGAYTGEISLEMLQGIVTYVIVGHSERRQFFHETDQDAADKAIAAAEAGLTPILCVGESFQVRERGDADKVVHDQLAASLQDFDAWDRLVIAYEPVWAIGTGRAASPETAQEMLSLIRRTLAERCGNARATDVPLLYGGSVNGENAEAFFEQPDIDGALVGSASLKPEEFIRISQAGEKIAS